MLGVVECLLACRLFLGFDDNLGSFILVVGFGLGGTGISIGTTLVGSRIIGPTACSGHHRQRQHRHQRTPDASVCRRHDSEPP